MASSTSGMEPTPSTNMQQGYKKPEYTSVADFYSGRSIFITGGTGFMGKVRISSLTNYIYIALPHSILEDDKSRLCGVMKKKQKIA